MSATPQRPVIFLAFANDRDDSVGYLRNLPDEARRLREVLEPAERAGLCEIVVRSNCTAADIFKVFQDSRYRNRIAILHYGGHANGYQLLLESASGESAAANAGGLARFLGQQQGLHLVFLNGCSTQHQTEGLLQARIAAVVSTSRAIDDKVAVEFACHFYQGLAGGAAIRTAYNEAEASVHTASGGNTRGLYFGSKEHSKSQIDVYRWPWDLFLRHGAVTADQWNLPEAANDPMFGLPPLPERDLPESPYRYLSWFRREDAEVFFGRGHEIRKLYGLITTGAQPIILFYGQSGVGKSSLLDAGLLPRLEQTCEVAYLRRRSSGLLATLKQALFPQASTLSMENAWLAKELELGKPLVVFLDQVEEFYTQPIEGMADELSQLLRTAKAIFGNPKNRPDGKLVLGFRKEWLAELESQMSAHELPRAKVSLEPLSHNGIIEVVNGPTRTARLRERYGLTVEDGVAESIARDMLKDRGSAVSTTLQIVLSEMWSRAQTVNPESPRFTQADYDFLEHSGVLSKFFNRQLKEFEARSKPAADSGLLLDVLAFHTTDLSSANECSREKLLEQYSHVKNELPSLLKECQNLYLLTETGLNQTENSHSTRLAHDTLAPLVRDKFDKSDKPGQRARRILDNRSVDWRDGRTGQQLDATDLQIVEMGTKGTRAPSETELRLIVYSQKQRAAARRWRRLFEIIGVVAVGLIISSAVISYWFWGKATDARIAAEESEKAVTRQLALATRESAFSVRDFNGDWTKAAHLFQKSATSMEDDSETRELYLATRSLTKTLRLETVWDLDRQIQGVHFLDDGKRVIIWGGEGDKGFLETRNINSNETIKTRVIKRPTQVLFPSDATRLICLFLDTPPQLLSIDSLETLATAPFENVQTYSKGTLCNNNTELMVNGIPKPDEKTPAVSEGIWNWRFIATPNVVTDLTSDFLWGDGNTVNPGERTVSAVYPGGRTLFVQSLGAYLLRQDHADQWIVRKIHDDSGFNRGFLLAPEIAVCFYRVDNIARVFDLRSGEVKDSSVVSNGRSGSLNPDGTTFVINSDSGTAAFAVNDVIEAIDENKELASIATGPRGEVGAISNGGRIEILTFHGRFASTALRERVLYYVSDDSHGILQLNQRNVPVNTGLDTISSAFIQDEKYLICLTGEPESQENSAGTRTGQRAAGALLITATDGSGQPASSIRHKMAIRGFSSDKFGNRICTWSDDQQVRVWKFEPGALFVPSDPVVSNERGGDATGLMRQLNKDSGVTVARDSSSVKVRFNNAAGASFEVRSPETESAFSFAFWDTEQDKLVTIRQKYNQSSVPECAIDVWLPDGNIALHFGPDKLPVFGPQEQVRSACLSADANQLFILTSHRLIVVGISGNELFGSIRASTLEMNASLSPDRKLAAVWSNPSYNEQTGRQGDLRVWDLRTLKAVTEILYHKDRVENAWFDRHRDYVFCSSRISDGSVLNVWSLSSSRRIMPAVSLSVADVEINEGVTKFLTEPDSNGLRNAWKMNLSDEPVSLNDLQKWTGTKLNTEGEIEYLSEMEWRSFSGTED